MTVSRERGGMWKTPAAFMRRKKQMIFVVFIFIVEASQEVDLAGRADRQD